MEIKLTNTLLFEPTKRSMRIYIFCLIAILLSLISLGASTYLYVLAIGLETLIFVWFETVWYPYGIWPKI